MSDRTGRRPLGTLTRHPADWFSDYSYTGGYQLIDNPTPGNFNYLAVGLYNNDSSGRVIKVYGISVCAENGSGMGIYFVNGVIGSLVGPVKSIRPDRAAPTGQIYQENTSVGFPIPNFPYNFGDQFGFIGTSGFDSFSIVSPFPLFIVPQGYSLVAANTVQGVHVGAFFWFQVADQ
jgi:hypothetical protein